MTSTSVSSYQSACRTFLDTVNERPGMFIKTLSDLELLMHGHSIAFDQLDLITDRSKTYNDAFGQWLYECKGCSAAAGWAIAIDGLADEQNVDAIELFFALQEEFMKYWGN